MSQWQKKILKTIAFVGPLKKFFVNLDNELDKLEDLLDSIEAQKMLDTKTKGISTYACEILHYGYNIDLDLLTNTTREKPIAILAHFME